jgi:hypothetical protein
MRWPVTRGANIFAGGAFTNAGGVAVSNIAKWDGSEWSTVGSGLIYSGVDALAFDPAGNLYAGGGFSKAGDVNVHFIAKWNGSSWSPLGSGTYFIPAALACDSSGNLYAAGGVSPAGGGNVNYIATWNGTVWSPLGSGVNSYVLALAVDNLDNLYAGGQFTVAGTNTITPYIAEALLSTSSYNLALTNLGPGTNLITGIGTPGYAYALDLATNLVPPINWIPQTTNFSPDMNLTFTNIGPYPRASLRAVRLRCH